MGFEEGPKLPNDSGLTEISSWAIVRYPLSLLGPGIPP